MTSILQYDQAAHEAALHDDGYDEGYEAGQKRGEKRGEDMLGKLILALQTAGRDEDITKAASDSRYRQKLYKELNISL